MTYSKETMAGFSLYEAIMRLTDNRDPDDYHASIGLSEHQKIGIDRKYRGYARTVIANQENLPSSPHDRKQYLSETGGVEKDSHTVGRIIEYDGKIEKQAANECADLISPLFKDLASGELQVDCRDMTAPLSAPVPVPTDFWQGPWHLLLHARDTVLTIRKFSQKSNGKYEPLGEYRLLKIKVANIDAQSARAAAIPGALPMAKPTRPVRGKSKDDEPAFAMMEKLIASGDARGPWSAAKKLVGDGHVKLAGAQPDGVYKRLSGDYNKTDRPKTRKEALEKAQLLRNE